MANRYKLPPASAYTAGPSAADQRWADLKRIQEGKPPIHAHGVTEAEPAPAAPVPVIPPLHELKASDPEAYDEIRRAFAANVFAGHVSRRGGGNSPFSRSVGD